MLTPINTSVSPPNGWSVSIPDAGPEIRDFNFSVWITEVQKRLKANGLMKHGWRDWVIDLMCQQRPDIPSQDKEAPPERVMTSDDVRRFLQTMWDIKEQGSPVVSEDVQSARVETCLACPKLGFIQCFIGCGSVVEALSQMLLGRKIRHLEDIHKKSCTACGCHAEIKTMFPVEILRKIDEKHETKPQYHPSCWILNEPQPEPESHPNIPPKSEPLSSPQPPPAGA